MVRPHTSHSTMSAMSSASFDQDPWAMPSPRQGGLRNRLKKLVNKRKSLPASPEYALPLSQPPPPLHSPDSPPAGLSVQLDIRYRSPLNIHFENMYETSRNHVPSDDECHGLLRRLDHGCPELITRRDSAAASSHRGDKVMRFELTFTVCRNGSPWAVKVYTSYQELPLDRQSALEVAEAADRLVGPYLMAHDKAFRWHPCERLSARPDAAIPPQGSTVSLVSVPLCRFVAARQEYESVPGYEISLVFRSQRRPRKPVVWERRVQIKSAQATPLTLSLGEDLTWRISSAVNSLLDARRGLRPDHKPASPAYDSDSDDARAHLDDDSLHVAFRIRNRIGFDFSHLERSTDSRLALFRHPEGLDCQEFVQELEHAIFAARDEIDSTLSRSDDLKISVRQLSGLAGTYWTVKNPFAVSLDSSVCYSRDTVQAILERVQTGISDVLSGNDVSITFAATKRGHVVLDKTLVAHSARPPHPRRPASSASDGPNQEALLLALKDRMQMDVSMVVRDTCSLVGSVEATPPNLRLIERRFDVPLPSPSTLVAESHYEPPEPHGTMSVDDVIQASMAEFAAINDDSIDSSSETTSKYQADPETPHRPIPFLKDQQQGISVNHDSPSAASSSATDEVDSASTRLSTPSLSDKDTETPHESVATTPNPQYKGQYTFERLVKGEYCTTHEEDDMKLPRRFALLSRKGRPKTPVIEAKVEEQPVIIDEKASEKRSNALVVENIETAVKTNEKPTEADPAPPADPVSKPEFNDEKQTAQATAGPEEAASVPGVQETVAESQQETADADAAQLSAAAEPQVESVDAAADPVSTEEVVGSTEPSESVEVGAIPIEELSVPADVQATKPADVINAAAEPVAEAIEIDDVVENLKSEEAIASESQTDAPAEEAHAASESVTVGKLQPLEFEPLPSLEGFLQYSALSPTSESSPESTGEQDAKPEATPETETEDILGHAAPVQTDSLNEPLQKTATLSAEVEAIQGAVDDVYPRTPEPQTPCISSANSTAGDSLADEPTIPFPELQRAPPSPALSTSSLTLWRPSNSFIPEELELDVDDDSPSRDGRPSTPHATGFFSTPHNVSPTASPSPAMRRPYLGIHKRQFSSPTAGYLGLLHGRGSPLRMQSYASGGGLDRATEEEDKGYSPVAAMQRRSSWALVALRSGPEVNLAARPSSSAGLPRLGDTSGSRGRSGSTLSASIWLN